VCRPSGRGAGMDLVTDLVRVAWRVRAEVRTQNLALIAAAVAFYALLAVFPAIVAVITVYGLVGDPDRISGQISSATAAMPGAAADLVSSQIDVLALGSQGLTIGLAVSFLVTVWAASGGVRALLTALNVIFGVEETRGLAHRSVLSLTLTFGAIAVVIASLTLVAAFPVVLDALGLDPVVGALGEIGRWSVLIGVFAIGLALLYRWGPDRPRPRRRWVTPGAVAAVAVWAAGSVVFSVLVGVLGGYKRTYGGGLAAVVVLMLWLYLSAFAVLIGAVIDAVRDRDKDVTQVTPVTR
jgi:membrane protein